MDAGTVAQTVTFVLVVATLITTGPLVDVGDFDDSADAGIGDGNATVDRVDFDGSLRLTEGRFGADFVYLRIPEAKVHLSSVSDHSRIVYEVDVPALGFKRVGTTDISSGAPATVSVGMADQAFTPDSIPNSRVSGAVRVRIQSFATDRVVDNRSVSMEGRTDG